MMNKYMALMISLTFLSACSGTEKADVSNTEREQPANWTIIKSKAVSSLENTIADMNNAIVCIPKSKEVCDKSGCESGEPKVLTVIADLSREKSGFGLKMNDNDWNDFASLQRIVLRCDINGCDDYRYNYSPSGAFDTLNYKSSAIKIGNDLFDNEYFEVASAMLTTHSYFGTCEKSLNHKESLKELLGENKKKDFDCEAYIKNEHRVPLNCR